MPGERALDQLTLSRSEFAARDNALGREWLVTNGLGGFACGTVAQANTRRYHGLLIAALTPPVGRTLMVAKLDAIARYQESPFELACNEFADGTIAPQGFAHLAQFHLEDGIPVWTYALAAARLEQRIWMAHGENTTYVSFTLRSCRRRRGPGAAAVVHLSRLSRPYSRRLVASMSRAEARGCRRECVCRCASLIGCTSIAASSWPAQIGTGTSAIASKLSADLMRSRICSAPEPFRRGLRRVRRSR